MIEILVEEINEAEMTASGGQVAFPIDMGPKKKKKRKYEVFKVSDDVFAKFRNGKTKFERWSKYLDLEDSSQKKIYDYARRHHNGVIILQNATTGVVRGLRFNKDNQSKFKDMINKDKKGFMAMQSFAMKQVK